MPGGPDIFRKLRLRPGQWRAVAERRFGDARCLLESGDPERATGAIYMAGFVIECLLKALLLERHPNLQRPVDPARLSSSDREVLGLLYSHELDLMLEYLPGAGEETGTDCNIERPIGVAGTQQHLRGVDGLRPLLALDCPK